MRTIACVVFALMSLAGCTEEPSAPAGTVFELSLDGVPQPIRLSHPGREFPRAHAMDTVVDIDAYGDIPRDDDFVDRGYFTLRILRSGLGVFTCADLSNIEPLYYRRLAVSESESAVHYVDYGSELEADDCTVEVTELGEWVAGTARGVIFRRGDFSMGAISPAEKLRVELRFRVRLQ